MITIRCSKCWERIFKYKKLGSGKILRCHLDRIRKDFSRHVEGTVVCPKCNQLIGYAEPTRIRMIQSAFIRQGSFTKKL